MSHPQDELPDFADIPDPFGDATPAVNAIDVTRAPSRTRDQVRRVRWMMALAAIAYEGMLVAMMGVRPDLPAVSGGALVLAVALPLAAAGLAISLAARGRRPGNEMLVFLLAPVALFAGSAAAHAGGVLQGTWMTATAMCVVGSAMLAAGPLALAAYAYRHAFAAGAVSRTVALGVGCGALAAAAIELRCSTPGAAHVLIGHGAALLLGGIVGMGLARITRA